MDWKVSFFVGRRSTRAFAIDWSNGAASKFRTVLPRWLVESRPRFMLFAVGLHCPLLGSLYPEQLTVMFADIQGFSTICEAQGLPEEGRDATKVFGSFHRRFHGETVYPPKGFTLLLAPSGCK